MKPEEPPLPLWTQIDMQDLAVGDALLKLLRAAQREDVRQTVAEAASEEKPKTRAAGQGALFDFGPDAFDPE
jgi:hypothetical protein